MISQIIWFLSLPVVIYITYRLALLALHKFEKGK
jgi:hypothetical protein